LATETTNPELTAWDHVQLARHESRPYSLDYIDGMIEGFTELHGDRRFGDDGAIIAGVGFFEDRPVAIIGHQKGRTVAERRERNFGAARPDGYRKAMRVMLLATKMNRPIITLIDTPGADCLEDSEGRGISEAIAANQRDMFSLGVPIVSVVIGEGGSGGAIGIGVGNRILMMENSYYSVIAPESCAAILWRSPNRKVEAAEALKLTAKDALALGIADAIIPEPAGGAHSDVPGAVAAVKRGISEVLAQLVTLSPDELKQQRWEKFRAL
jgi:acetyl-CoA carboxylase carboxyl transferase subunit alpha